MDKLAQRVVTAIALVAGLLVVFFLLPAVVGAGILGLFVLLAAWEWAGFLSIGSVRIRLGYILLIALLLGLSVWQIGNPVYVESVLWIGLVWWVWAFLWVLKYPTPIPAIMGAVCGILVLVPSSVALVNLFLFDGRGPELVLLLLCIVWAADVGAYFTGRRIGRVKLAPQVSPGKTWEGVIGGLLASASAAVAGALVLQVSMAVAVPLALAVAAISVIGDLTVSMFKRNAGLKDSGKIFPGHGGIMDRVDGVTAAAPLFSLTVCQFGLLQI